MRLHMLLPAALLLAPACKPPPDAPATLDDLCGYIYDHFDDEDPEALEVALQNLYDWMTVPSNLEATLEGYQISNLNEATVEALDGRDHDLDDLEGAAVGTQGDNPPEDIAEVLVLVDPEELSPGIYEYYDRTIYPDREQGECFVAGDCETVYVYNDMVSKYVGIITVATSTYGQYRWVEMEGGPAMVQRTWLGGPADVSPSGIVSVDDQFYLNIAMPDGQGALRLQATWMVAKILMEGLDMQALDWVIDSMQKMYEDVDEWIDTH